MEKQIKRQTKLHLIPSKKLEDIRHNARIDYYKECISICQNNWGDTDNAIADMQKVIRSLETKNLEDEGR